MSQRTRCRYCGHTPGAQPIYDPEHVQVCVCACHAGAPQHRDYRPTLVQRQPSKSTGEVPELVIRKRPVAPARHAPVDGRQRIGWYTTGGRR